MIGAYYQGETIIITRDVTGVLGAGFDFTGVTLEFSYAKKSDLTTKLSKTPTYVGMILSVPLTPLETSTMEDYYVYEFKIKKVDNSIVMVERGEFFVHPSLNPTFGIS